MGLNMESRSIIISEIKVISCNNIDLILIYQEDEEMNETGEHMGP